MICNMMMCDGTVDEHILQAYEINDQAVTTPSICPLSIHMLPTSMLELQSKRINQTTCFACVAATPMVYNINLMVVKYCMEMM